MKEFKLSAETTRRIVEEAQRYFGKAQDGGCDEDKSGMTDEARGEERKLGESDGFVQVLITRPHGEALLGVDSRATREEITEWPGDGIVTVSELSTVLRKGTCKSASSGGGYLSGQDLPDWMCGDHEH